MTQRPAVIALVVAIAGMMFPAISAEAVSLIVVHYGKRPTLDVKLGSWLYSENKRPHVSTSGNKIEYILIVFIEGKYSR